MSSTLNEGATTPHTAISLDVPLSTIADFVLSLRPLSVEQRALFRKIPFHDLDEIERRLFQLQLELLQSFSTFICSEEDFDSSFRKHVPWARGESAISLGEHRVSPYTFYTTIMTVGSMPREDVLPLRYYKSIALHLGLCDCAELCSDTDAVAIKDRCLHLMSRVHYGFFSLKIEAYRYHVLLQASQCTVQDVAGSSHSVLRQLSPGELELRDQLVSVGSAHTIDELLDLGAPQSFIQRLSELDVCLSIEEKNAALQRMRARSDVIEAAWIHSEDDFERQSKTRPPAIPLVNLPLQERLDIATFQRRLLDKQEALLQYYVVQPTSSPTDPTVAYRFWRIMDLAKDYGEALEALLPIWATFSDGDEPSKEAVLDACMELTFRVSQQQERKAGECGLAGVPLYCVCFEELMILTRNLHGMLFQISGDMSSLCQSMGWELFVPEPLGAMLCWPSHKWLGKHDLLQDGFSSQ